MKNAQGQVFLACVALVSCSGVTLNPLEKNEREPESVTLLATPAADWTWTTEFGRRTPGTLLEDAFPNTWQPDIGRSWTLVDRNGNMAVSAPSGVSISSTKEHIFWASPSSPATIEVVYSMRGSGEWYGFVFAMKDARNYSIVRVNQNQKRVQLVAVKAGVERVEVDQPFAASAGQGTMTLQFDPATKRVKVSIAQGELKASLGHSMPVSGRIGLYANGCPNFEVTKFSVRGVSVPPESGWTLQFDKNLYPISNIDDYLNLAQGQQSGDRPTLVSRNLGSATTWVPASWDMGRYTGFWPNNWNANPNSVQRSTVNEWAKTGFQAEGETVGWVADFSEYVVQPMDFAFMGIAYNFVNTSGDSSPFPWRTASGALRVTVQMTMPDVEVPSNQDVSAKIEMTLVDGTTGNKLSVQNKIFHTGVWLAPLQKVSVDAKTQYWMAMSRHSDETTFNTRTFGYFSERNFPNVATFQFTINRQELGNMVNAINSTAGTQVFSRDWSGYKMRQICVNTEAGANIRSGHIGVRVWTFKAETFR